MASGNAGRGATSGARTSHTGPGGSFIAACAACAAQCAAESAPAATVVLITGADAEGSRDASTIIGAHARVPSASPTLTVGASAAISATPGASSSCPVIAAMVTADAALVTETIGTRAARIASRRVGSAPSLTKTRATPARRKPSATTSAAVTPALLGERREHRLHALEGATEIGLGVGVGESQVAFAVLAERGRPRPLRRADAARPRRTDARSP